MGDLKIIPEGVRKVSDIKYWLWLSTSAKLPPRAKASLLEHYRDPENMYFAPLGEITALLGEYAEGAEILEARDLCSAMRILDKCEAQGIRAIAVDSEDYPERLKNIYSPPPVIYVKGIWRDVDLLPAISVIGTRKASPYGLRMGRKLGFEIAKCGGTVVSGLTRGIDAAGAEGALLAEGECIGVLGVPHEKAGGKLFEELCIRGSVVSEYPPGTVPNSSYFRARNRISSGLSVGVAVVEAPLQSGTKLFVAEALEQGKEVFAVPGNADSENCEGTNALLKDGAAMAVTCGWDVMSEFEARFPAIIRRSDEKMSSNSGAEEHEIRKKADPPTKKVIDKPKNTDYIDLKKQLEGLSEVQMSIVSAINAPATHVDDIIERTGLAPARVLAELTMLQLKGFIKQESGKRFTLNIQTK